MYNNVHYLKDIYIYIFLKKNSKFEIYLQISKALRASPETALTLLAQS